MTQLDSNMIMIAIVAVVNLGTALITYRTHKSVQNTDMNVHKIELATNSMKDALVKVTGEEAFNRGLKQGEDNPITRP